MDNIVTKRECEGRHCMADREWPGPDGMRVCVSCPLFGMLSCIACGGDTTIKPRCGICKGKGYVPRT